MKPCPDQASNGAVRRPGGITRRHLLAASGAAAGLWAISYSRNATRASSPVFLAAGQRYDERLEQTIREGLLAVGVSPESLRGKRVLLKPNLVEPFRTAPQITTDPTVIAAAAEVFRRWDATVAVGEGPGHMRDTEFILDESRLAPMLRDLSLPFTDLNYDDMATAPNRGRTSKLREFFFPRAILEADLVVSLPKLKTHHWMGMTAALKNMYGTLPGLKYGWPKNVLHYAGIPQTVVDINASLPPTLTIVDGILCMEGDGPILGTAKPLGIIAVGTDLTAVDATCARIIGLVPELIPYLQIASNRLGTIDERHIDQRGIAWRDVATPFTLLDVPHLRPLLGQRDV